MKILKFTLLQIIALAFIYLTGAFYSVSFDISKWTEECRLAICITEFMICIVLAPAFLMLIGEK